MKYFLVLILLILTGCATAIYQDYERLYGRAEPKARTLTLEQVINNEQHHKISYSKDVKPILDNRCVVCHGCYDAPCQLKLGSGAGIDRGATKQLVYDATRLKPDLPTRLFIDESNTKAWRGRGFYSVLNERTESPQNNIEHSVLAKMLQLKQAHPQPLTGKLNDDYDLTFDRDLQCPAIEEFSKYSDDHANWGMPYAMPNLSSKEHQTIMRWLEEGAKVEPLPAIPEKTQQAVKQWEDYFNGTSLKQRLVARYIYEHLFIGHLHFKGHEDTEFFQLVRSKTPTGQVIQELKTPLPNDDPNGEFFYRLRPVTETIVDKTHFVYELSAEKMQRFDDLFFKPDYTVTTLPSYQADIAANPFKAFNELPMKARHQFLLDDAQYFVSGFIKGPVCRGQVALNSIREQFWVVFTQPGQLAPKTAQAFLDRNKQLLDLPAEQGERVPLFAWLKYDSLGKQYIKSKDIFINQLLKENQGFGLHNIWNGDKTNPNAALTVFRHLDSATVMQGLIGDTPLTAWVVDYPIFEQLHYLLVADFNIYGTVGLQLASRTYMDILRQDAEDNFLRLMPAMARHDIYNSWYQDLSLLSFRKADPVFSIHHETQVKYKTQDYKKEFFEQIRAYLGQAAGSVDSINRSEPENSSTIQQQVNQQLRKLAQIRGHALYTLPDTMLLKVKTTQQDLVYTLLLDKAYSNISSMLADDARRLPEKDKLTIYAGFIGSYPNFFFSVDEQQLNEFIDGIIHAEDEDDMEKLYQRFGIRRTHPEFWQYADWFNEQHKKQRGLQAGLLDLNRYDNL